MTDADWIAPAERPSSFPAIPCGGGSDPYASCAGVRYDAPVTDEFKVARRYKLQVRGTDMAGNSNVDDHIIWRLSANLKFQKVEWAAPPQETCDVVGGGGASSGDSGIDGFTLSMAVRHLEPTTQELGYGINRVELVDDFGEEGARRGLAEWARRAGPVARKAPRSPSAIATPARLAPPPQNRRQHTLGVPHFGVRLSLTFSFPL